MIATRKVQLRFGKAKHSNMSLKRKKILVGAIVAVIILGSVTVAVYSSVSYLWPSTINGSKDNGQNVTVNGEELFEDDEWMQQVEGHRELLGDWMMSGSPDSCDDQHKSLFEVQLNFPDKARLHKVRWLQAKEEGIIQNAMGIKHSWILMEYHYWNPGRPDVVYVQVSIVQKTEKGVSDDTDLDDSQRLSCTDLEDVCNVATVHKTMQEVRKRKGRKRPLTILDETKAINPKPLYWEDHESNIRSTVPGVLPYDMVNSNCHHYAASIWYMASLTQRRMPNRDKIHKLVNGLETPWTDREMTFSCKKFTKRMINGSPLTTIIRNWHRDPEGYLRGYCLKKGWKNDPNEPHRFVVTGACSWKYGPITWAVRNQPYG